eukprot:2157118-Ditylum_brightwellii.AAC.1
MEHTQYDLRASRIHTWFRQIQCKDVVKGFYLQNLSPDAELKFWSKIFKTEAKNWLEGYAIGMAQANLKIALKHHLLNNGYQRRPTSALPWTSKCNLA